MTTASRSRRIEIRVSDEERRLEEAAAGELGQTLSEFIRQAALARADEVLRQRGRMLLDDDTAARFIEALDEDAPPRPGMVELFRRDAGN
jgi:uncharacterized protein (DUF1778 family)